jgi:hypothetical protein
MGTEVTAHKLYFVSFEPTDGEFRGLLSMEAVFASDKDPRVLLVQATRKYVRAKTKMASIINEISIIRSNHKHIPARKVWQIGNVIFTLVEELKKIGLQIDGIYDHLERDLKVKRKWLEKVITLRRYLPDIDLLPNSLNWGRCEKGTRRIAEKIRLGLFLS